MDSVPPIPFIPSADLKNLPSESDEYFNSQHLSILGCVHLTISDANIDGALEFLERNVGLRTYVDVRAVKKIEDIVTLINAGVLKVFVTSPQWDALRTYASRLILIQMAGEPLTRQSNVRGILLEMPDDASVADSYLQALSTGDFTPVYIMTSSSNMNSYVAIAKKCSAIPIIPTSSLTTGPGYQGKISIPTYIAAVWKSDREDKLITTVVTDPRGQALGLVYSNEESLAESLRTGTGVYQSRKRGLWHKGATSGDTQKLLQISLDCDLDCLKFTVQQNGQGFCHLSQSTCFGDLRGLSKLETTLISRKQSAPVGSYTSRLFSDEKLLCAKIMEEAEELCAAKTKDEVAFEAADLIYFALTKAVSAGVSLADIEQNLDMKSLKIKRRQGDAKSAWVTKIDTSSSSVSSDAKDSAEQAKPPLCPTGAAQRISMKRVNIATTNLEALASTLQRPSQKSTEAIMDIVKPIIKSVREGGDQSLLNYTHKFEKATSLKSPVLKAPYPQSLMNLPLETIHAIDISFENIRKFHTAQMDYEPLHVETMHGINCSRFVRPIERVGLYVPGGTAVLPSTALMLGVPAMVAGCKTIIISTPPRADGSVTPEIVYVAHKIGAEAIVLAGGAQAVAAMAYGTESVTKVDKILGPGNQFVTAAKMYVSNDTSAGVSIDMPAGPSELLVIADKNANPAFVASDLLSQAEHGVDSQVILIAIDLSEAELEAIEGELNTQALALPRVEIVRGAIKHSVTLVVKDLQEAMTLSNRYAPEHLILHLDDAEEALPLVINAGSVFVGPWSPESVGDYSAGVNHALPTYGYAKQYSGVSISSFTKYITSSRLTTQGLRNVGPAVMQLAKVEELEAHRRAVELRLKYMDLNGL